MNTLLFGVYPYVAISVCILGCWGRYKYLSMSCSTESDMLLASGRVHRFGLLLFHAGAIPLLLFHLAGLLAPHWSYAWIITPATKQLAAMIVGGVLGAMIAIGLVILLGRRIFNPMIRRTSKPADYVVLAWLLFMDLTGLGTIYSSAGHPDGHIMLALAHWVQHTAMFQADAADFVAGVPLIYKIHIFFGMTILMIVPFTRLIHVPNGYRALALYWWRSHQIVRAWRPKFRRPLAVLRGRTR